MRLSSLIVAAFLFGISCGDASEQETPERVTGVISDIESTTPIDVQSFTLTSSGTQYEILIDPETEYDFALSHLNAHRTSGDPVVVELEERDGKLYATSIADVGGETGGG